MSARVVVLLVLYVAGVTAWAYAIGSAYQPKAPPVKLPRTGVMPPP